MRMIEYPFMLVLGGVLWVLEFVCEVWHNITEYEKMRYKGYRLMQDEDGNDFWVGYGD